jgi:hypothetical protein
MTTPRTIPVGPDPRHIWHVCVTALADDDASGYVLETSGRQGARARFRTPSAAGTAHDALCRAGYDAIRPAGPARDRQVIIRGWSEERLDARLGAMRGVLHELAGHPAAFAEAMIDGYRETGQDRLPGADREQFLLAAAGQLTDWIHDTSGVHGPPGWQAPAPGGECAFQVHAVRQLEMSIQFLAGRAVAVAGGALELYAGLRGEMVSHDRARAEALGRMGQMYRLHSQPGPAGSPLLGTARLPGAARGPGGPARSAAAGPRSRPGSRAAREFPAGPPSLPGPAAAGPAPRREPGPSPRPAPRHP